MAKRLVSKTSPVGSNPTIPAFFKLIKMKNRFYFYDLHSHTKASDDAISSVESYIKVAKKRGLTGFAITDHDKIYDGETEIDGVTIIPGSEITLKDGSHLLAYYIKNQLPEGKLTLKEAVEEIKKEGGYCSLAHPTNIIGGYFQSGGYFKFRKRKIEEIREALNIVDCVEIGNAAEPSYLRALTLKTIKKAVFNELKIDKAKLVRKRLIYTAGSDAHSPCSLGRGVIKTKEPLTKENFLRVVGEGEMILKTKLNFTRWILYNIEHIFVILIKITRLYDNKVASKTIFNAFANTYLKSKYFLLKKRKSQFFNFQEEYNIKT